MSLPTHFPRSVSTETRTWRVCGDNLPRSEIVYFCQISFVFLVIIAGIVNLSLHYDKEIVRQIWTILITACLGYVMPQPTLNHTEKKKAEEEGRLSL